MFQSLTDREIEVLRDMLNDAWRVHKSDPDWTLRTFLPGLRVHEWKLNDLDDIRAQAERILRSFVRHIGAGFKEDE